LTTRRQPNQEKIKIGSQEDTETMRKIELTRRRRSETMRKEN
jgi:hypothetical protein